MFSSFISAVTVSLSNYSLFACFLRASKGDLVPFALLHLLHCLLSRSASVAGAAYTEIRSLAVAKSIKLQAFFSQYKKPICQVKIRVGDL